MRPYFATLLFFLLLSPFQTIAESLLQRFPPVQGKLDFIQSKQIQGLPVPLVSQGYLLLQQDDLLWHTTSPLESKLLISAAGVSEWQQEQYVAVAGSEFVGQLMLAVLQQQESFITGHFAISAAEADCLLLSPLQAPLTSLFRQITLCGDTSLQQIRLEETNGNTTDIRLRQDSTVE